MKRNRSFLMLILCNLCINACQGASTVSSVAEITPTISEEKERSLTICLAYEPQSLYPYGLTSQVARDVLQAIYDGPIDTIDGKAQPIILEKLPALQDGSASLTPVSVQAGDTVVNTYGELVSLQAGTQVFPSGCSTPACALTWDGSAPLQLDQPSADFRLLPGLTWSDGQPLLASDSVYSFELASDADTPVSKTRVNQTAEYSALDERTVHWVGKLGLVTDSLQEFFWMPLPQHAWGSYSAAQLLEAEESTRRPLGWGAYVLEEWQPGEYMRLKKNPGYFRAAEGLPKFDHVIFKFLPDANINQITEGTCDIVSNEVLDLGMIQSDSFNENTSDYDLRLDHSAEIEFLAFGITPASYDDYYYPYGVDRPDIFGDVNVRKAFALCINRQRILEEFGGGLLKATDIYLVPDHALLDGLTLNSYSYDPEQAKTILDQAGWKDLDQDPTTPRSMALSNSRVPIGTKFEIALLTSDSPMRSAISQAIADDLAQCGIEVSVEQKSLREMYQPAPDGIVFGRNFDTAILSMRIGNEPTCELFNSTEIPNAANYWLGSTTGGANFFGFVSNAYDEACNAARAAGMDEEVYRANHQTALHILNEELPIIPLFHHPDMLLANKKICLPDQYQSMQTVMMSIEQLDPDAVCE